MKLLIEENFSDHTEVALRDPILYGDYRNVMTEEPRLYEDIVDYNASKAIFEEVSIYFIGRILASYIYEYTYLNSVKVV